MNKNSKFVYKIIIIVCMLLFVVNIISVIWSINDGNTVNASDVISIVVTLILGISTIIQSHQENENSIQSLQLDVKNHMPYFVVNSIIKDIDKIEGYKTINNASIDTSLFDSSIYKESKLFALVGFANEKTVNIDFLLKNASDILVSKLNFFIYQDGKWIENKYNNPILNMVETTIKKNCPQIYDNLHHQHYNELFSNEYSNMSLDKEYTVHLSFDISQFTYPLSQSLKNYPDALFFKIRINCVSIYGEEYIQTMDLGLRLNSLLKGIEGNKYNYSFYENWAVYEIEKISSKVEISN